MEYYIPFAHQPGRYAVRPMDTEPAGNYFHITLTYFQALEYRHPRYGNAVRVYNAPEELTVIAAYGKDGQLTAVTFRDGEQETLVYTANPDIDAFIAGEVRALADRILEKPGETARLFFECFYDGESADFAVKPVSPADMEQVRTAYGADAVNSSGNYPSALRMACDTKKFLIMLVCLPESGEAFYDACRAMREGIIEQVLPKLNKTADFQIIAEEYD